MCVNNFTRNRLTTIDQNVTYNYNINRDYNPITGRYIQSDPIGLDGGSSTFAYVNGNPVMFVDLEGLSLTSDTPSPIREVEDYGEMVIRLWNDIKTSYVAQDIKDLTVKFMVNSELYGDLKGEAVSAIAYPYKNQFGGVKGTGGIITFYKSIWETSGGIKSEDDMHYELTYTMFHELQHLRKYNNYHPPRDAYYPQFFNQVTDLMETFSVSPSGKKWI